jgi:copper transporter 1
MSCPHHSHSGAHGSNPGPSEPISGAYVQWGQSIDNIFFSWWHASSKHAFWGSVVLVYLLCVIYEFYIAGRSIAEERITILLDEKNGCDIEKADNQNQRECKITGMKRHLLYLGMASLYGFQTFYAFFLMMVFMTYNGFLIVAMTLGFFTGRWFILIWKPKDVCLIKPDTACH